MVVLTQPHDIIRSPNILNVCTLKLNLHLKHPIYTMTIKTTINIEKRKWDSNENVVENEGEENNKPNLYKAKANKMFYENVLKYNQIYYINVKEVSCLAVRYVALKVH